MKLYGVTDNAPPLQEEIWVRVPSATGYFINHVKRVADKIKLILLKSDGVTGAQPPQGEGMVRNQDGGQLQI